MEMCVFIFILFFFFVFMFSFVSLVHEHQQNEEKKRRLINEVHRFIECVKSLEMQSTNIYSFFPSLSFFNFALHCLFCCTNFSRCVLHFVCEVFFSPLFENIRRSRAKIPAISIKLRFNQAKKRMPTKYDNNRVFYCILFDFLCVLFSFFIRCLLDNCCFFRHVPKWISDTLTFKSYP